VQDIFSRLIAAAFQDDTRIHEVSYLLAKLKNFAYSPRLTAEEVKASELLAMSAMGELATDKFIIFEPKHKVFYLNKLGVLPRG
jgi:hypothetical protein